MKPNLFTEWLRTSFEGIKLKKTLMAYAVAFSYNPTLMAYAEAFSYNPSLCRELLKAELLSQFPQLDASVSGKIVDAIIASWTPAALRN